VTPQAPGIGAVSEVVGSATITHADGSVTTAVSGSPIALGDIIQTSANGAISVAFADQTTLAMSENARLQVDQYVYNPTTQKGTSLFSFLQGAFVYVSGLIGKNNPGNENIEAPVGEIGIRGTEFIAQVTPDQSDVQMDLIEGEVGLTPSLGGGTTIMDAPETASFNGSSVSSPTPLTESTYEQLEAQLFPVIPTFEVSPVSLSPATPAMTYGPLTLQAVNLGMSTSPFTTTLKWKKVSLPKGLKLSSTGVLSGTLNKALTGGLSSVSVQVTESVTNVDGKQKVKTATTALATIPLSIVQSQPAVTSVRKNSGPSAGGTTVSIKGTSLQGASEVKFGTVDATSFAVNSAGSVVTASTPAEGAGPVDVTVIDPGGTSSTSPADVFTFTP